MTDKQIEAKFTKWFLSIPAIKETGITDICECNTFLQAVWIRDFAKKIGIKPSKLRDLVCPGLALREKR